MSRYVIIHDDGRVERVDEKDLPTPQEFSSSPDTYRIIPEKDYDAPYEDVLGQYVAGPFYVVTETVKYVIPARSMTEAKEKFDANPPRDGGPYFSEVVGRTIGNENETEQEDF